MLPLQARVDTGAMATKGYSASSEAPALLESHHQIFLCHIQDTRWVEREGGLTPSFRETVYSTALQPTGQYVFENFFAVIISGISIQYKLFPHSKMTEYSNQIISQELYGFKYFYLILLIIFSQGIISICLYIFIWFQITNNNPS